MAPHRKLPICFAAVLLLPLSIASAQAPVEKVDNIKEAFARFRSCWKPPPANRDIDIDITVIISFDRSGNILGKPRVTYQSEQASDNDRLMYRIAAMEALQRCTPMPFTEGMAGAVAGRPFAIQFHNRKPKPEEKRAWLTPKIL